MKKFLLFVSMILLLTGCGESETFETIADEQMLPAMAQPQEILVSLPGETAMPVVESDNGRFYLAGDYEIHIQTLEAGDLNRTVKTLSGFERDALTVMETEQDGMRRYEFVWSCAGENGDRLGRAVILDDGSYHYTMTVLRDADTTENTQIVWHDVFASFSLA